MRFSFEWCDRPKVYSCMKRKISRNSLSDQYDSAGVFEEISAQKLSKKYYLWQIGIMG